MPIYEYVCKTCGHELDALQKMADAPLVDCPACNQPELKRKLSAPSFRLKGQGWYETDFKKDNKRNLADDGKSDKPKDSGDKSGKSETKSGSKSDSAKKSDGAAA
ncbi:MAG: zinc ribbon domain-containing protein [Pseudomonadota bacterium]